MKTIRNRYLEFTPSWSGFDIKYHVASYFDSRPMLQIYFIWGKLFIYLPWKHYQKVKIEKSIQEIRKEKLDSLKGKKIKIKERYERRLYDSLFSPEYGVYYFCKQLGICYGVHTKLIDLPWTTIWIQTKALRKDGEWEIDNKTPRQGSTKDFWDYSRWKDILYYEKHPYIYIDNYNNKTICEATIRVEKMEWSWKWFKWCRLFKKKEKRIQIELESNGKMINSCSYKMLKNETPHECLKRMEKERIF